MRKILPILACLITVLFCLIGCEPSWNPTAKYKLIFDDEFNGTSLNLSKWTPGWFGSGNTSPTNMNEIAGYSSANVSVSNGSLNLTLAHKPVTVNGKTYPYTGALVSSNGHFSFTYGYIEFRAYLPPSGNEIANWPALWTDGKTWPQDGEMDILEGLGGCAAFHFHSPSGGPGNCAPGNYSGGFHTFGASWQPGTVTYYYDGKRVGSITEGITGAPMFLVLENTISNDSPLASAYPVTMKIDWVRVWA